MRARVPAPMLAAVLAFTFVSQGAAQGEPREEIVRIPAAGGAMMITTVMRPPGADSRPLVVINHGSPADESLSEMQPPRFSALSSWFVSRGYVVALPLRRGYGQTGGAWAETYGPCANPDYFTAGLQGAADITATLDFMRKRPFVSAERSIVVGQSAGGWAAVALSSLNPPGVSGMVNFAGGRGGRQELAGGRIGNCAPEALVQAVARYGTTARVPMLWLYAANDSYFGPDLARRMADAYNGVGGRAIFRPLGAFAQDGHTLAGSANGVAIWSGLVADFLASLK